MAADESMTISAEVVAKTLLDERADFLRESVRMVARELMEAEITGLIVPAWARFPVSAPLTGTVTG